MQNKLRTLTDKLEGVVEFLVSILMVTICSSLCILIAACVLYGIKQLVFGT